MNDNNKKSDLFEFLKYILGCTYISDLRIDPYNTKAKLILKRLYLGCYSLNHISDAIEYLYNKKNEDNFVISSRKEN